MKTLYIDIYFLINFTVDLISLHFAAIFSKIKVSNQRLLISALIGALCSSLSVLISSMPLSLIFFILTIILAIAICVRNATAKRRAVFGISLIIFLSLVGSIVSFAWNVLEDVFSDYLIENDTINRKMLFFALIALLSIGVFKMLITVMTTGKIDTKVEFEIKFLDRSCSAEALVDTGNLAIDPLSMKPVFIIKKELAERFLSDNIINLSDVDSLDKSIRKRIRLIPLTKGGATHVFVGLIPDEVKVHHNGKIINTDVTIAIDKDGGDFGGFLALMPFSAISNAIS